MTTIRLIPPQGYDTIKPLHDSTERPVRCVPTPTPDPVETRSCCRVLSGCCPVLDCDDVIHEPEEAHR